MPGAPKVRIFTVQRFGLRQNFKDTRAARILHGALDEIPHSLTLFSIDGLLDVSCTIVLPLGLCVNETIPQMWYIIKRTVKHPCSPSVLKVQRVIGDKTNEYTIQDDMENFAFPDSQCTYHDDATRHPTQIPRG